MSEARAPRDSLNVYSIDWALTHILKHGDTDLFPVPFEYLAVRSAWGSLKQRIAEFDLGTYQVRSSQRILLPKQGFGFRVALQLDPIDTIVYTALSYEAADQIESARVPRDKRIACSYRFQKDPSGDLFDKSNGWDEFHLHGQELAMSGRYAKVITADIADFYNQIGHHRVRNALEHAGITSTRAINVERLLMGFTGGQSRGLPVGPTASVVFSEACLNDVDMFLIRKGYVHTRYVDDFRIFCEDEATGWRALHDLTEYLYTSHRLALQGSKTKMLDVEEFIRKELIDPGEMEFATITEKLDILRDVASNYGYSSHNEVSESAVEAVVRENLQELFQVSLMADPPHLGVAKYLLRRATALRTGLLRDLVFEEFSKLLPILREVAVYLAATTNQRFASEVATRVLNAVRDSGHLYLNFTKVWAVEILQGKFSQEMYAQCEAFLNENSELGIRPRALLALQRKEVDWVRERKETWQNHTPWDRRSIIWAGMALSKDEANFWLKRVQGTQDVLDSALAEAALVQLNAK